MLLALIVTSEHDAEALMLALPGGTTITTVEISEHEYAMAADKLASQLLMPMIAQTQQQRPPQVEAA